MCSQALPCPLCSKPNFKSVDALRISLVAVTNRPLTCPICSETVLGLDKLTIHLFSHSMAWDSGDQRPSSESNNTVRSSTTDCCSWEGEAVVVAQQSRGALVLDKREADVLVLLPKKCKLCELRFATGHLLAMHLQLMHSSSKEVKEVEEIEVEKKEEEKEEAAHQRISKVAVEADEPRSRPSTNEMPFQCNLCSKAFKMKGSLRVHMRVVHMHGFQSIRKNQQNTPVQCNNGGIEQQQQQQQQQTPRESAAPDKTTTALNVNSPTGCGVRDCGPSLVVVVDAQTSQETAACSPDRPKSWECDICTKSFTTKYFLKKHKRLHTGEMPYTCSICGKTFTFQQSYHKHLLYHSDEKPHVCGTCGRAFKELSTLHNHERIHSGEKPFNCETCGKCFRQRVSYLVHRRIHTGVLPYKCTACAKSFRYKVSQRTHKCPAQPPGTVVRQSGELLQKLLQNSTLISSVDVDAKYSPTRTTINDNDEEARGAPFQNGRSHVDELIDQSIKDIVQGAKNRLLYPATDVEDILGVIQRDSDAGSPNIQQLQNLCLYSIGDEDQLNHSLFM